jgi:hypothetical protein
VDPFVRTTGAGRLLAERAPERLLIGRERESDEHGWASGDRQKTATPTLATLARREIAIKRVVVLAEDHALAPGAALT